MVVGTVQNQDGKNQNGDGKKKVDSDGNVIAAVNWDEQDANDKFYHWILAVSNKEENGEEKQWEPLDVRQTYQEMEDAGHPFVEQRTTAELASSGDEDEKSSGPPGMESSSDEDDDNAAAKARQDKTMTIPRPRQGPITLPKPRPRRIPRPGAM